MQGLSTSPVTQTGHHSNGHTNGHDIANHSDVAQRALATLETVRSACDRLAASANIPSPWESDLKRDAIRERRGFDATEQSIESAEEPDTVQWVRLNVWIKHNAELRAAGHVPAPIEHAYWTLYELLDEHFPDGDTIVCPVSRRQLSEGASEAELFAITVDTGESRFDVDAREADLRVAFVAGLRGIAERNLAAADAIDQATGAPPA